MCTDRPLAKSKIERVIEALERNAAETALLNATIKNVFGNELRGGNGLLGALYGDEAVEAALGPLGGGAEAVMPLERGADGRIDVTGNGEGEV